MGDAVAALVAAGGQPRAAARAVRRHVPASTGQRHLSRTSGATVGPMSARRAWGVAVVAASVLLVAVVAVVAEGRPVAGPRRRSVELPGDVLGSILTALLLLLVVAGAVFLIVGLVDLRRAGGAPRPPRRRNLLATVLLLVLLAAALALHDEAQRRQREDVEVVGAVTTVSTAVEPAGDSGGVWPLLVLAVLVPAVLLTAWLVQRRVGSRQPASTPDAGPAVDAEQRRLARASIDDSIDELYAEPDPRRAIVKAYARLLDGFERCGLGRQDPETPFEHLGRVLAALDVRPAPAQTLTTLFAEARFSRHAPGVEDQRAAIDALLAARDDLSPLLVGPAP